MDYAGMKFGQAFQPDSESPALRQAESLTYITWLGSYGVDANGKYTGQLVIDSTGITPQHVDSNNRIIPEGVHIRPFLDGADGAPNTWYFKDLDHVLRIVQDPS
jgi:hypothetical protein